MKQATKENLKKALVKDIFEVEMNTNLVHQVFTSQMSNQRQVIAHTKDRAAVSGGGRKPWKQKGTGKARHGSIRSPLWIGGGVTFGPTNERNFKKGIPTKMKRKALFMVLSDKVKNDRLILIEGFDLKKVKTQELKKQLDALKLDGSCLIVLSEMNDNVIKSARNIQKVATMQAKDLSCRDLLTYKYVITTEAGIDKIKETFVK